MTGAKILENNCQVNSEVLKKDRIKCIPALWRSFRNLLIWFISLTDRRSYGLFQRWFIKPNTSWGCICGCSCLGGWGRGMVWAQMLKASLLSWALPLEAPRDSHDEDLRKNSASGREWQEFPWDPTRAVYSPQWRLVLREQFHWNLAQAMGQGTRQLELMLDILPHIMVVEVGARKL